MSDFTGVQKNTDTSGTQPRKDMQEDSKNSLSSVHNFRSVDEMQQCERIHQEQEHLGRRIAQDKKQLGTTIKSTYSQVQTPYEIYIHVPFCLKRCGYCDFNTYTAVDLGGGASRENYANLVIQEATAWYQYQSSLGISMPKISTIFFGGGTPTILPAKDLIAIVKHLQSLWGFETDCEITTEANPDTVDDRYISELAQGGFNRISMGMQSAVPSVLKTLDRTHQFSNVVAGVQAAKHEGLRSSVDLIYGTPGESLEQWKTSIEAVLNLGVNHISAYALSLEPTTKMGRQVASGQIHAPEDDDEAEKYEMADSLFHQAGFNWYEISNWARNGEVSRHNLGYWKNADWIGLGPGAHSHLGRARMWDTRHPKIWAGQLSQGNLPWGGYEWISPQECIEEFVMLGLRLAEGLDLNVLKASYGLSISQECINDLVHNKYITMQNNSMIATVKGRLLNDSVIRLVLDNLTE